MVSDGEGRAGRDPDPGAGRTSPGQMEDVFWAGWNLSGPQRSSECIYSFIQ